MRTSDAVVLVGGLGTRLRAVVSDRPKPLAEVRGRPFVSHLLDQLAAGLLPLGLRRVVLCCGYLGHLVEAALGPRHGALQLLYSHEPAPLGTGGALRQALPHLPADGAVVVCNGDSYCDVDLPAFLSFCQTRGAQAGMVVTQVPDREARSAAVHAPARYGHVRAAADGRVLAFVDSAQRSGAPYIDSAQRSGAPYIEKGTSPVPMAAPAPAPTPALINAGIYCLDVALLRDLPAVTPLSLERDVFPRWIAPDGPGIWAFPWVGRFLDIGTPESYRLAEAVLP